jgi:hypothetical protein
MSGECLGTFAMRLSTYNERTAQLTRAVSSAGERSAYTREDGRSNLSPPTRTLRKWISPRRAGVPDSDGKL